MANDITPKHEIYNTGIELHDISGWSRHTVADGKWLNINTIKPASADLNILASAIHDTSAALQDDVDYLSANIDNLSGELYDTSSYLNEEIIKINARADVTDVVGTYAEFESLSASAIAGTYNISDRDIIKVLDDEQHNNRQSYYRYLSADPYNWEYVGDLEPYYNNKTWSDGSNSHGILELNNTNSIRNFKLGCDNYVEFVKKSGVDEYDFRLNEDFINSASEAYDALSSISGINDGTLEGDRVNHKVSNYSLAQGSANSATNDSFAQGKKNTADNQSIAQGSNVSASDHSFAQGYHATATDDSFAQGEFLSAKERSFAQGDGAKAFHDSFAQGNAVSAYDVAFAQGDYVSAKTIAMAQGRDVEAYEWGFAQGFNTTATTEAFAQGSRINSEDHSFGQGQNIIASYTAFGQGIGNEVTVDSFGQGISNTAYTEGFTQGSGNIAEVNSFAQGKGNSANHEAFTQGLSAIASTESLAQGQNVTAKNRSFAQGSEVYAESNSLAQGYSASANNQSLAQGINVTATTIGFAHGDKCSANNIAFAQGQSASANDYSMAQGQRVYANYVSFTEGEVASATSVSFAQGNAVNADSYSFVQGHMASATNMSMAQGHNGVSASQDSFAQGENAKANTQAIAQGNTISARDKSIAQGYNATATTGSFAQGSNVTADYYSISQGLSTSANNYSIAQGSNNSAFDFSQAFGNGTKLIHSGMAIGTYNSADNVPFVIGNGTGDDHRSDLFLIDRSGNVSAAGNVSAKNFYIDGSPINSVVSAKFSAYNGATKVGEFPISAFKLSANNDKYIVATTASNTMAFNVADSLINSASSGYQAKEWVNTNGDGVIGSAQSGAAASAWIKASGDNIIGSANSGAAASAWIKTNGNNIIGSANSGAAASAYIATNGVGTKVGTWANEGHAGYFSQYPNLILSNNGIYDTNSDPSTLTPIGYYVPTYGLSQTGYVLKSSPLGTGVYWDEDKGGSTIHYQEDIRGNVFDGDISLSAFYQGNHTISGTNYSGLFGYGLLISGSQRFGSDYELGIIPTMPHTGYTLESNKFYGVKYIEGGGANYSLGWYDITDLTDNITFKNSVNNTNYTATLSADGLTVATAQGSNGTALKINVNGYKYGSQTGSWYKLAYASSAVGIDTNNIITFSGSATSSYYAVSATSSRSATYAYSAQTAVNSTNAANANLTRTNNPTSGDILQIGTGTSARIVNAGNAYTWNTYKLSYGTFSTAAKTISII